MNSDSVPEMEFKINLFQIVIFKRPWPATQLACQLQSKKCQFYVEWIHYEAICSESTSKSRYFVS